jgi:uncharacterized protein YlxW (UPF0749 family)
MTSPSTPDRHEPEPLTITGNAEAGKPARNAGTSESSARNAGTSEPGARNAETGGPDTGTAGSGKAGTRNGETNARNAERALIAAGEPGDAPPGAGMAATVRRAGNPTAAQVSGGLAGAPAPDPDGGGTGKRTFTPDFLTELFRNPLDPGYADAAARKAVEGDRTGVRKWSTRGVSALTLTALGFLLVVAYQQTVADEPSRTKARATLIEQVQKRRDETVRLQGEADRLGDDVSALREKELGGAAVAQLRELEAATGLASVRGAGAKIMLSDGPTPVDPLTGERNLVARVKDTDLQLATNALWSLGAEAISINGQRLTATTTIRQAGEAILVDQQPVANPYEVLAIGPGDLADGFRDGYAGRFFKQLVGKYGMTFDAIEVKNVTLEAATELKLRVARPSTAPPAPSPSGSASGSAGTRTSKAAEPHSEASSEGG